MATAKPHRPQRAHRLRNGLVLLAVLAAAAAALFWPRLQAQAMLASAYGARIACTCHYIEGRNLNDCRRDFEPGMALVKLSDNPAQHIVTARFPLMTSQSAGLREGAGCVLQNWVP